VVFNEIAGRDRCRPTFGGGHGQPELMIRNEGIDAIVGGRIASTEAVTP
jgi:hypothetical protein